MTVCVIYARDIVNIPELIIASDSRLSGGEDWDFCRKVFPLSRGDSAIVFTGDTYRFFPLISQITAYCEMHKKIYSRAMSLPELFGKLSILCETLIKQVSNLPRGMQYPAGNLTLLLCGWDWWGKKKLEPSFIGKIQYRENSGSFISSRCYASWAPHGEGHGLVAIGDCLPSFYSEYNKRARKLDKLDYEPLKIMQEIIDCNVIRSIGGVVQGAKIYQHYNSLPLMVDRGELGCFLYGRKVFEWENVSMEASTISLDT